MPSFSKSKRPPFSWGLLVERLMLSLVLAGVVAVVIRLDTMLLVSSLP